MATSPPKTNPAPWSYDDPASYTQANLTPEVLAQLLSSYKNAGPGGLGLSPDGLALNYSNIFAGGTGESWTAPAGVKYDALGDIAGTGQISRQVGDSAYHDFWNESGQYDGRRLDESGTVNFRNFLKAAAAMYGGGMAFEGATGAGAEGISGMDMMADNPSWWSKAGEISAGSPSLMESMGGQNPINSPSTSPTGTPSGSPSGSPPGTPNSGTKTFGDKVMDTLTSPSTVRAAVGAAGAIAGANKSGDSMSDLANSNVNPATLVPLLQSIYGDNWRDQLNASRYNIVNDSGTSTWSQTPSFNETGYNAAMKAYNDGVAAGNKNLPAPTREQFTTSTWTNTSKLSPDAQKLKDTSSANNQWIADSLTPQMQKYASTVNAGVNRTGIPNYQYTANTKDQQQQNPNSLPTYQNITDTGKFQTPQYGQLTQGPIQNKVQTTSRDWAGALAPQIENYSSRLSGRDPFSYYQQGADAAYGQATRYLLPKQQQDMQALESRLGEQGFVPGTPAYAQALRQQLDSNAVALADARDRAITAGQKGGYDAYTGETTALTGAMTGLNNLGTLGVSNDTNAFKQNLDAGNFFNDAQGQTFDQSKIASDRVRQTGLDANTVAQQLFDNTVTMTDTNNKNATNTFTNLRDLTSDNNKVIGANNKTAFDLADLNNKTVTDARTMANTDYTTDTNALQKLVADALGQVNKGVTGTTAPGAGISNVGAAQTPDLAALLQQFFGNNVNIANAGTTASNQKNQALVDLLLALIPKN